MRKIRKEPRAYPDILYRYRDRADPCYGFYSRANKILLYPHDERNNPAEFLNTLFHEEGHWVFDCMLTTRAAEECYQRALKKAGYEKCMSERFAREYAATVVTRVMKK